MHCETTQTTHDADSRPGNAALATSRIDLEGAPPDHERGVGQSPGAEAER
jgi:hypothetical protein